MVFQKILSNILDCLHEDHNQTIRLEKQEKKLKSARILGKKHCLKCGFCCYRRTCIPTPSELKKIAKFLKLTPKKLINKYFVIDRHYHNDIYFLKPAGIKIIDLTGKFIPAERTFNEGKCIFLDKNNLCKIHPVRPKTARDTKCWIKKQNEDMTFITSWSNNQLLKQFGIDGQKEEDKQEN